MNFKRFSYVLIFAALAFLAYAVHDARRRQGADIPSPLLSYVANKTEPQKEWAPNETVTGNILAAGFAQNQRDWTRANIYLDRLNNALASDESTTLRMMLLAVTSGQFDRATEYARRLNEIKQKKPDNASDGNDLAALILTAQSVRAGDIEAAEQKLSSLQSKALKSFAQPVLIDWLQAGQKKPISDSIEGLSLLQALHKGLAAEWGGQKDVANRIFDSLARAPLTSTGALMVAAYDLRQGRVEKARAVLTESFSQNPMDQQVKTMLDALSQGDKPEMRPELSYHLKGVTAGVAMAFRDLAQMMIADKAPESGLVFAQIGCLVRPDVPSLSILVGNIFFDQERYKEAAEAFMSVQPEETDYVDAQIRLAELRAKEDDAKEAIKILEGLMTSNPGPRVAYALGEIYRADGDNKKAVTAFDQTIEAAGGKPDDALWSVYFVRAMALDELGEWDKAEADLKKALEYRPDNPHVLNYLAYSWADRGIHLEEARAMLLKALSIAPTDPFITDSLGWVRYKEKQYDEASILLERAVSLKPYDPVLNDHLGDAYAETGRMLEARYQWRRALDYADVKKVEKLIADIKAKLEK